MSKTTSKFTPEVRDRALRVVLDHGGDQFRALDLDRIKRLMNQPVLVELRNVYRSEDMVRQGFRYSGIGRG